MVICSAFCLKFMDSCRFPSCSQMLSRPGLAYSLTSSVLSQCCRSNHRMGHCANLCHILQQISKTCADDLNPTLLFEAILSATAASGSLKQRHQPIPTVVMESWTATIYISDHLLYLSVCQSIHPSIHPSTSNPSIHLIYLSMYVSVYLSVYLSIYLLCI